MLGELRRRITYANVMATIAVFGVLAGGGAYAASKIGPKDIAKNAVRAKHVKKRAVRAKHLQNRAVTKRKLAPPVRGVSHFARVDSTGTLVDGTAADATRTGVGNYSVEFPVSIRRCAAAASSAIFPGYDLSVPRIATQIQVGFPPGGPETVEVDLFDDTGGFRSTSFTLVLACP